MAAENIKVEVETYAPTKTLERYRRALKRLKEEDGRFSSGRTNALQKYENALSKSLNSSSRKFKKHFDFVDKGVQMFGKGLKGFLSKSIKAVIAEMGLLSLAMLGVHALFITGQFLAKAWGGALQIAAAGVAALTVAAGLAAAAIREQQAAMFAFRGRGASELGSGLNQARAAMRNLQMDADLAGLGVANLNKAYAVMAKTMSTPQINASTKMFAGLMDFGSAGQDPGAAMEAVGAVIAGMSDRKKSLEQVMTDFRKITGAKSGDINDPVNKALKGIKTKDELRKRLDSGELAKAGGVEGQFAAVNNTLIGQVKTFLNLVKGQFADFGQSFLAPAKEAFQKISNILFFNFRKLFAATSAWGSSNFFDGMVTAVDKISSFFVRLVQDYLPKSQGMFSRMGDWWSNMTRTFRLMADSMRPLIDGARILEEAFMPIWKAIKQGGADNLKNMRDELVENKDEVLRFGEKIGILINAVSVFAQKMKSAFFDILPLVNNLVEGLTSVFRLLTGMMTKFAGGGMMGSLFPLMLMRNVGSKMGATKGSFLPGGGTNTQVMNVTANSVNLGGPGVAPGTAAANRLSSGATSPLGAGLRPGYTQPTVGRNARGHFTTLPPAAIAPSSPWPRTPAPSSPWPRTPAPSSPWPRTPAPSSPYSPQGVATSRPGWRGGGGDALHPSLMKTMSDGTRQRMTMAEVAGFGGGAPKRTEFGTGPGGSSLNKRQRRDYRRATMRYNRNFSKTGNFANNTMKNSVGARMGAGMGLAAMSQYGPEEMRGAMALGGVVSQVDPMLGIAVAGLGGAMKAKSAGSGALAGAAGGAALGMKLGGTPAAAAIGGALGLIAGAIMGGVNGIKERAKLAKAAIGSALTGVLTGIMSNAYTTFDMGQRALAEGKNTSGMRGSLLDVGKTFRDKTMGLVAEAEATKSMSTNANNAEATSARQTGRRKLLNRIADEQALTKDQRRDLLEGEGSSIDAIITKAKASIDAFTEIDGVNEKRIEMLGKMSGKSAPQLEQLAKNLGVNLYDATIKFDDMVTQLKLNVLKSADEMRMANQNALLDPTSLFDAEIKKIDTTFAVDEKAVAIRNKFQANTMTNRDMLAFQRDNAADNLALTGGDAVAAYFAQQKTTGVGGTAFTEEGSLQGMEKAFRTDLQIKVEEQQLKGLMDVGVAQYQALGAESNLSFKADDIRTAMKQMNPAELEKFLSDLQGGKLSLDKSAAKGKEGIGGVSLLNQTLGEGGLISLIGEKIPTDALDAVADKMEGASEEFRLAVEEFKNFTNTFFSNTPKSAAPSWWNERPVWADDTSTPRGSGIGDTTSSRISQTLARHQAMNSQLTGTRTVTSGYRTTNLGSVNSDHVTGRAIDLVGQNLGQYAVMARANGGFAEFHGGAANRHLHVVPGPGMGGVGDTAVPSMRGSGRAASATSGGDTYATTLNVYPSQGMNENQLANLVMQKINDKERNSRERS